MTADEIADLVMTAVLAVSAVLGIGAVVWSALAGGGSGWTPPPENLLPPPRHYHQLGPHSYPCSDPSCRG